MRQGMQSRGQRVMHYGAQPSSYIGSPNSEQTLAWRIDAGSRARTNQPDTGTSGTR